MLTSFFSIELEDKSTSKRDLNYKLMLLCDKKTFQNRKTAYNSEDQKDSLTFYNHSIYNHSIAEFNQKNLLFDIFLQKLNEERIEISL